MRGQDDEWKGDPANPPLPAAASRLRDPETSLKQYLRNFSHRHWEEDYFPARTTRQAARWLESNHKRHPFSSRWTLSTLMSHLIRLITTPISIILAITVKKLSTLPMDIMTTL